MTWSVRETKEVAGSTLDPVLVCVGVTAPMWSGTINFAFCLFGAVTEQVWQGNKCYNSFIPQINNFIHHSPAAPAAPASHGIQMANYRKETQTEMQEEEQMPSEKQEETEKEMQEEEEQMP